MAWLPGHMLNHHRRGTSSLIPAPDLLLDGVSSSYDLSRQLVTNIWNRARMAFLSFPCKYLTLVLMTSSSSSFHTRGSQLGPAGRQSLCSGRPRSPGPGPPFGPTPPSPAPQGLRNPSTDLSGEQNGRVEVFWVPVAAKVEPLLPVAEAAQGKPTIVRHLGALRLIFHYHHLHHHQVDGVANAGVLVDAGRHRHECQDVVLSGRRGIGRVKGSISQAVACPRPSPLVTHPCAPLWAECPINSILLKTHSLQTLHFT